MKKVVVQLDLQDGKGKQKAMKTVSKIAGIDFIAVDMKEKKMTVIGDVDPVKIAVKLRKMWRTEIVSVGPAKQAEKKKEKKEEPRKEEPKKDEKAKKGEGKKEEPNKEQDVPKEEGEKKEEPKKQGEKKRDANEHILELINSYDAYNHYLTAHYYVLSAEENPNACIIS